MQCDTIWNRSSQLVKFSPLADHTLCPAVHTHVYKQNTLIHTHSFSTVLHHSTARLLCVEIRSHIATNMASRQEGTFAVKAGLAQMLKGGVIMDVTNVEEARIAEEAGACAVMALERVPADIRRYVNLRSTSY